MELSIEGVDWKVVNCEPSAGGIVTLQTSIYTEGTALRADEVKQQQMREDEELARRLQRQEAGPMFFPPMMMHRGVRMNHGPMGPMAGPMGPVLVNGPRGPYLQRGQPQTPEQLLARLREVLRTMPRNDENRPMIQALHDQIQGAVAQANEHHKNRGLSVPELSSFPTRKYKPLDDATKEEVGAEVYSCMVCLEEFEEDEILRTLPCFHSFHMVSFSF